MLAFSGLLGLVLFGGEPTTGDPASLVDVRIRIVDLKGVSWRGPVHKELKPVGRQGAACVWVTDKKTAEAIQQAAEREVAAPAICAAEGASAKIQCGTTKFFVAELERVANGPEGKNTQLAYRPTVENAHDGITTEVVCRTDAEGTRMGVRIDESRLLAMHTFTVTDTVIDAETGKTKPPINAPVQVPELAESHVQGEWKLPKDAVLVVSLGVRTSKEDKKNAGPRDLVVLINPTPRRTDTGAIRAKSEVLATWVSANAKRRKVAKLVAPRAEVLAAPAPFVPPAPRTRPVPAPVLPLIASPIVKTHDGWRAGSRTEAQDASVDLTADVKLDPSTIGLVPWPFVGPMLWLASEKCDPGANTSLKPPTPPTRNLPSHAVVDSSAVPSEPLDASLPPLPDSSVELSGFEVHAEPQAAHVLVRRMDDSKIGRVAVEVGTTRPFRFFETAREEVVLFPAPKPMDETDCPEHTQPRVTHESAMLGCPLGPHDAIALDDALLEAKRRLGSLSYYANVKAAKADPVTTRSEFVAARTGKPDDSAEATEDPAKLSLRPFRTRDTAQTASDPAKSLMGSTLLLGLKGADGACESNSEIRLKSIEAQPVTLRLPMADGSVVEIQARVVKPAQR